MSIEKKNPALVSPEQKSAIDAARAIFPESSFNLCTKMGLSVILAVAYPEAGDFDPSIIAPHATNMRMTGSRDGLIMALINCIDQLDPEHQRAIYGILTYSPEFEEMRKEPAVTVVIPHAPSSNQIN